MSDKPDRNSRTQRRDPWSVPVTAAQIPATGLHKVIEPSIDEAHALASAGELIYVRDIRAEFNLKPVHGDQIRVEGHVTGRVGQTCVITLDPIDNPVDETVELLFAPPEQISAAASQIDDGGDEPSEERPDLPEPIMNGVIDLGRVATDAILLGLDLYPRKPGVAFEPPKTEDDPDDHPFAALKSLKSGE